MSAYSRLAARTCQWDFQTSDGSSLPYSKPCLHCTWHENVPAYFAYYHYKIRQQQQQQQQLPKHVWLQHPAAYMKPIHTYLEWNRVDYVLGSSGHGGQEAMESLISKLKQQQQQEEPSSPVSSSSSSSPVSYSSAFFSDGPAGPVHKMKPGVIQVAQATGLPILPIRFEIEGSFRTGWDQKHFPIPYTSKKIRIQELAPILVGKADDDPRLVGEVLEEALRVHDP